MTRQAEVLFEFWPQNAKWFIVGGTADGDEAQCIHEQYPDVRCIGFDPNPEFVRMQNEELDFPGRVYPYALWHQDTFLSLITPKNATARSASVCRPEGRWSDVGDWEPESSIKTMACRLDQLSEEFGGFENIVLWIDIEGAELLALEGARQLLERRMIKLINFEAFAHLSLPAIDQLLFKYGFSMRKVWNIGTVAGRDAQDYIYALEE